MTDAQPTAPPAPESHLADRYGTTRTVSRRTKAIAWIAGIGVAVVFLAWVVWGGLDGTASQFDVRDTGYELTDTETTADFQVTVDPGTPMRCAVQALNEQFEIVGWKVVDLPPSETRTAAYSVTMLTTMPATTGLINRCWLP